MKTFDIYRDGRLIGTVNLDPALLLAPDPESVRQHLLFDDEWPHDIAVLPRRHHAHLAHA